MAKIRIAIATGSNGNRHLEFRKLNILIVECESIIFRTAEITSPKCISAGQTSNLNLFAVAFCCYCCCSVAPILFCVFRFAVSQNSKFSKSRAHQAPVDCFPIPKRRSFGDCSVVPRWPQSTVCARRVVLHSLFKFQLV